MNTRVDLIFKSEQRSASVINLRMLTRLATVLVPTVVVVVIAVTALNMIVLNSKVNLAESAWKDYGPKKQEALALRERCSRNEAILSGLRGWGVAKVKWGDHLLAIQKAIRPKLQLNRIQIVQGLHLIDEKYPARVFAGTINGMGIGPTARVDVEHLQGELAEAAVFTQAVASVSITFGAAPEKKQDRVFKLDVAFRPMVFNDADTRN